MFSRNASRSIFALEEHDSAQIDPCAADKGPQFVLPLASVAGLVVPGVEAELEDGGLDIVPFISPSCALLESNTRRKAPYVR